MGTIISVFFDAARKVMQSFLKKVLLEKPWKSEAKIPTLFSIRLSTLFISGVREQRFGCQIYTKAKHSTCCVVAANRKTECSFIKNGFNIRG